MFELSDEIEKYYTVYSENLEETKYIIKVIGQQEEEIVNATTLIVVNGEINDFEEMSWIRVFLDKESSLSEIEFFEEVEKDKSKQEILSLEKGLDLSEFY